MYALAVLWLSVGCASLYCPNRRCIVSGVAKRVGSSAGAFVKLYVLGGRVSWCNAIVGQGHADSRQRRLQLDLEKILTGAIAVSKEGKSKRDPERTREAILSVACKLLAKDGPEGLSVSEVAQLAGVNRGTAYHHFPTREELLSATTTWVSERLCREVFGDPPKERDIQIAPQMVIANLTSFAMENPEFGRVWLYTVLSSNQPASDPFWNQFKVHVEAFAQSELAQPGIDCEVHAAQMLVGLFLWPIWARVGSLGPAGRRKMAERYSNEVLRSSLFGIMRSEMFPGLAAKLGDVLADKDSESA